MLASLALISMPVIAQVAQATDPWSYRENVDALGEFIAAIAQDIDDPTLYQPIEKARLNGNVYNDAFASFMNGYNQGKKTNAQAASQQRAILVRNSILYFRLRRYAEAMDLANKVVEIDNSRFNLQTPYFMPRFAATPRIDPPKPMPASNEVPTSTGAQIGDRTYMDGKQYQWNGERWIPCGW